MERASGVASALRTADRRRWRRTVDAKARHDKTTKESSRDGRKIDRLFLTHLVFCMGHIYIFSIAPEYCQLAYILEIGPLGFKGPVRGHSSNPPGPGLIETLFARWFQPELTGKKQQTNKYMTNGSEATNYWPLNPKELRRRMEEMRRTLQSMT